MAIPKMDLDLEIIQKLSDLPNAYDGLSAEELKAKFDEAGLEIKGWINNTLIPALTAAGISFAKTNEIDADTIQAAIENVQSQIKDAATGTIVNGSVTKEKLASELLDRIYGGCTWVCLHEPTAADTPDTGFPLGQMWLKRGFTMHNYAKDGTWTATNGTMTDGVFAGDKTAKTATAVFGTTAHDGSGSAEGEVMACAYKIPYVGAEVTGITAKTYDGTAEKSVVFAQGTNYFTTTLSGTTSGAFSLSTETAWGSASVASEGWTMQDFAVVNTSEIQSAAGVTDTEMDWESLLESIGDFTDYTVQDSLFIQVASGVWWQFGAGCGLSDGYMKVRDGKPYYADREQVVEDLGALRLKSGTYTGDGATSRTLELGIVPKVLFIGRTKLATYTYGGSKRSSYGMDNGVTLMQGCMQSQGKVQTTSYPNNVERDSTIKLTESTLTFWAEKLAEDAETVCPPICNEADAEYVWTAVY